VPQAHKKRGGQAEQALGRSRGGFSTKIHVTVDALGNPLRLHLTAGQRHDSTQAIALLDGFQFDYVIADRGYAAQDFVDWVLKQGCQTVIPAHQCAKQRRDYDTWFTVNGIW